MKHWLAVIAMLLTGCALSPTQQLKGSLTPPPGFAYAIVSLTAISFEPEGTGLSARYRAVDHSHHGGTIFASLINDTIFARQQGGPMVAGRLELLTLPPGEYEFYEAAGAYHGGFGHLSTRQVQLFPMHHRFHLAAGETVYLGKIEMDLRFLPELIVSDNREQDLGHAERIWQIKDLSPVQARILQPAAK